MAKSSINFQTATAHSNDHMNRKSKVNYLIEHALGVNQYKHFQDENQALERAEKLTKEKTGRKMQKLAKENFVQEAVLNLNANHNLENIEKVFNSLKAKYGGFEVFNIAVHKDEGVFIRSKYDISKLTYDSISQKWTNSEGVDLSHEVISIAPNRDIFYNKNDKIWYSEKTYITPVDTSKLQKHMNYHAHITFTKFDFDKGKNVRLQKKDMQDIQTLVAKTLGMERGEKGSNRERLNHWQLKKQNDTLNAQKIEQKQINTKLLATQTNLQNAIKKQRDKLKQAKAQREQYKELEQLNRDLKQQIKNGITSDEMQEQIKKFEQKIEEQKQEIENLKNQLEEKEPLNAQKRDKKINVGETIGKELKIDYKQTIKDLELKNKEISTKAKKEQLQIQNYIKKELKLTELEIIQEPKGFWYAVKTKINDMKDYIKDLLSKNTELEKENKELQNGLDIQENKISKFRNFKYKIETEVIKENEDELSLDEIVERIQNNQIKIPEQTNINRQEIVTPGDHITAIPTNEDDTNTTNQTKQTLNQIQTIADNTVSIMKGIQKINDPKEMKKAAMQSAAGIAGIAEILKTANDTSPGEKDNIRRYEQRKQ